ncbi:MAG: NADH-quinone oxidoreductase subunit D [Candidatus Melainabacteria bacterium]|nr:NADH-quinone oxidoreductase subunit D [Candidatus Melainabacteria bacterium]
MEQALMNVSIEPQPLPVLGVTTERDFDTDDMVVNIGPQHPSTHGVLRLITTLDGEVVKEMQPVIGYLHRSKEKMGESRSYFQYQPTIDRVEYLSSFFDHYVYVSSMEAIAGLKVPRRVQYIRMIAMELNRISSHLLWFGTFLLDLGATSPLFYAFRDREEILKLFEDLTGARMMYNYFRFGGVTKDLPPGWLDEVLDFVRRFPDRLAEYEAIVNKNPIFLDRTIGQGILDKDLCLEYGVTGPSLRAAGVAQDLRKTNPYCCYDAVEFDVPVAEHGDTFDRYKVRFAEMRESLRIIEQCCRQIPGGDTAELIAIQKEIDAAKAEAREPSKAWDSEWNTMGQKVNLMVFKPPVGEAMTYVESPRGMLGCYIMSDGTPKAYRIKWRGASFSNLSVLPTLMKGHLYPDLMAIFGSLDVILPEVDR